MINNIHNKRVVVAMSGGVDSSVAAALLKCQGYNVSGVFMQFWAPTSDHYNENKCCSRQAWQEARQVAGIIGIPIYKVNFGRQFKQLIVDEFLRQYQAGLTPNPCVACNKFIKFDLLLKYVMMVFNADYLATGHYARLRPEIRNRKYEIGNIINNKNSKQKFQLIRAKDLSKDQTYFLYNLKQNQLKHLLFPLGGYRKTEVRALAKKMKLPVFAKPDSQEICFVGGSHYDFLKRYLKLKPGKITDVATGRAIGVHQGLPLYTLGQRSGIGLSGGPWYVCGFKRQQNVLLVTKNQCQSEIYRQELNLKNINWLSGQPKFPLACAAQIRYQAKPAKCAVKKFGNKFYVSFSKSQRAAMPGQSVVFYEGDKLLGGAIITR